MIPAAGRFLGGGMIALVIVWLLIRRLKIPSPYSWLLILGVVLTIAAFFLVGVLRKRKQKKNAKEFEDNLGLQSRQAGVGKEEIREALDELSQKWEEAVKELRAADMAIYDLPWFLLIGEPQSGKSTTIQKSGLEFPVGTESLSGSGGTRNCDWWFTNEAVILDTAGRFTFQEANAPDQHEWNAFLKLLSRHRKQCPINGVVVVIPVTSLVEDPVDIIESKAKNIRSKLQNLQKALGIRFPVFVLITKSDRILGFTEFFSRLDPIDQRQLFGWSAQSNQATPWDSKEFDANFSEIFGRVHKLRLKHLHAEDDASAIDKLFVFPEELAALREPLALYLSTVFGGSRFEEPLMLRGFYFTSGIQQGRPFALACKELLRVRTGDPEGVLENLEQVFSKSRAFFIRDFYEKKAFPEQGLVKKTREAVRKEKTRRRVLFGGIGLIAILLIPLLILAFTSLRSTVGATTENVHRAEKCLGGEDPCSASDAYKLIQALEKNKNDLQRKRLARWMFLKGANNPVVARYIPAAQGALFSKKIIKPLQETFDHRAGSLDWLQNLDLYLTFRDAFTQILRIEEISDPNTEMDRRNELRRNLEIKSILEFCSRTQGGDPNVNGKDIDEWLTIDRNAPEEANRLFTSVLRLFPKVAGDNPSPSIRGSRNAMLRFWNVETLAGWDFSLIRLHFEEGFFGFLRRVEELDARYAPDRDATLAAFSTLTDEFVDNWEQARELMATGRPISGSAEESPGASPDQWRAFCRRDFGQIRAVSAKTFSRSDIDLLCDAIPDDYRKLEASWHRYDFLVLGQEEEEVDLEADETTKNLTWSEEAVRVHNAIMPLRKGFESKEIESARERLANSLGQGLGMKQGLDEINEAQKTETATHITPIDQIANLDEVRLEDAARILRPMAELGVAARLLPPVREFFVGTVFDPGNESLFTAERARENVPKANDFLVWAQRTLSDVSPQPTTNDEISAIDGAIYNYVRDLVEREIASMGGGGGGTYYVKPQGAARAQTWRAFVDAVDRWNHVGTSRGRQGSGSSTGINSTMLANFAQQNARLESLSRELRNARPRTSAPRSGPVVAATVERSILDFKDAVGGLDADPLEAWRELAEKPENLEKFHAFSRLRGGDQVSDLRRDLEEHGAELLTREIEPEFARAYRDFWREVDNNAFGVFPFITQRQLDDARAMYSRGYHRTDREGSSYDDDRRDRRQGRSRRSSGDARWENRTSDTAQRVETIVLELPTVTRREVDDVFAELSKIIEDYALTPILNGSERMIDFVGTAKPTLRSIQGWAQYLGGDSGSRRRSREETFEARLLSRYRSGEGTFLLEQVNSIDFFDGHHPIRSSTEQYVEVPMELSESSLSVIGVNEDRTSGWTGRLVIEGGEFKLPYYVLIAADAEPTDDRKIWEVLVEIPAFKRSIPQLHGIFEFSFDRGIPDVLPNDAGPFDD
jgi:DNA polymerase III delta prime subunit